MTLMKLKGKATIDDLLRMPEDGNKYELVDGEIVMSPVGMRPSQVAIKISHIGRKIGEFLECGVVLLWLVDPRRETVTVYRSLSQTEQLDANDTITAEPVLPGFSCLVSRFFQ